MNILQVNNIDLPGRRFNGYDLMLELNKLGHKAYQFVAEKEGNDNSTICFVDPAFSKIHHIYQNFERKMSMHGLIYPYGRRIMESPYFRDADLVHYHLIHNHIISLYDFEDMVAAKPSIWSLHDPWAFTGHCVHPLGCEKWKSGCHSCPQLDLIFSLQEDKAYQLWNIKKEIYSRMDLDIVVASNWMLNLVKQSPLMNYFDRVHLIPFGVKLNNFGNASKEQSRLLLRIPQDNFVIAFRGNSSEFKGMQYIVEMLNQLNVEREITLLTVGQKGILGKLKEKYSIVELDWVDDDEMLSNFYSACDIFIMPSIAESFGLMAVEAMASGRAVVVFDGTALKDVTFSPDCGVVVDQKDTNALTSAVESLIKKPDECENRGKLGRKLAEKHYNHDTYIERMLSLYEGVASRKRK